MTTAAVVREQVGPWSASFYLRAARVNGRYAALSNDARELLRLLTIRADDHGSVRFARCRITDLYPRDWDEVAEYWRRRDLVALDVLQHLGFVRVIVTRYDHPRTYVLTLPHVTVPSLRPSRKSKKRSIPRERLED